MSDPATPTNAELASVITMTADRLADEWPATVIAKLRLAAQRLEGEISEAPAFAKALGEIRTAIEDYYLALDRREHGGIACHHALEKIQKTLGMSWKQGAALEAVRARE